TSAGSKQSNSLIGTSRTRPVGALRNGTARQKLLEKVYHENAEKIFACAGRNSGAREESFRSRNNLFARPPSVWRVSGLREGSNETDCAANFFRDSGKTSRRNPRQDESGRIRVYAEREFVGAPKGWSRNRYDR